MKTFDSRAAGRKVELMAKLYITGASGVGKSTLGVELNKRGLRSFDLDGIEGLCHWRHRATKERAHYNTGIGKDWLDAHEYICDQEKLEELISDDVGNVAVLGLASNQDEFLKLFDKLFLLHCKEETFLHRLNTRDEGNNFAKDKSEQGHILAWYKDFEADMRGRGAIPLNGENPTSKLADEVMRHLNN